MLRPLDWIVIGFLTGIIISYIYDWICEKVKNND